MSLTSPIWVLLHSKGSNLDSFEMSQSSLWLFWARKTFESNIATPGVCVTHKCLSFYFKCFWVWKIPSRMLIRWFECFGFQKFEIKYFETQEHGSWLLKFSIWMLLSPKIFTPNILKKCRVHILVAWMLKGWAWIWILLTRKLGNFNFEEHRNKIFLKILSKENNSNI